MPDTQHPFGAAEHALAPAAAGAAPPTVRFRIELGQREPLSLGLYRVCLQELDEAISAVRSTLDAPAGIHTTRKTLKRLRALIRMVRDEIGPEVYHAENSVLRDVSRVLSPIRSSQVLARLARHIVVDLGDSIPEAAGRHFVETLGAAAADREAAVLGDPQARTDVLTTLLAARSRFESWPVVHLEPGSEHTPRHPIPDSFASIEPGIRRVYRRGRDAMHHAAAEATAAAFHEWRKRAKYLRHEMEALHLIWPEVIGGMAESLDTLSVTLGDEHDLAELSHVITSDPSLVPDDAARRALLVEISQRRIALQQLALRLGEAIYPETPRAFTARLEAYWNAARR